jgi:hypothetical protein
VDRDVDGNLCSVDDMDEAGVGVCVEDQEVEELGKMEEL